MICMGCCILSSSPFSEYKAFVIICDFGRMCDYMAECKIILERHGQSEGNLTDSFLGHTDLPLTELGHKQVECTAEYLKNEHIDAMYSSDLIRAFQTGQALAKLKGMELIPSRELREVYAGKWEGMSFEKIYEQYPPDYEIWLNDIGHARCTGGESAEELDARICAEVFRLASVYAGKTVFISTHATPIRVLITRAIGYSLDRMKEVEWVPNASVTVIGAENGKLRLIKSTYSEHLGELITRPPRNV